MKCPECGNSALVQSCRRIRVDRGEIFDIPIPAIECPDCGRAFADEGAGESVAELHSAPTEPPPAPEEDARPESAYVAWSTGQRSASR
jgi:ribosomal protein S27E